MNNELLGAQIAKYRRAAGITQEELGKAVGVSTQAVSRWECGGAPDVSLLPAVADKLGVSIDTLFGRSEGKAQDIYESLHNWLLYIPKHERMDRLFHLLAITPDILNHVFEDREFDSQEHNSVALSSYTADRCLLREVFVQNEGLLLAIRGEDCPFYLLMPEPDEGYEPNLFSIEKYRELFEVLGRPGAMEILTYLHRRGYRYFTVYALARHAGLDLQEVEPLLKDMARINLLNTQTIESERGMESIYSLDTAHGFIPFLFMARWIIDPSGSWRNVWSSRDNPLLPTEPAKEEPNT